MINQSPEGKPQEAGASKAPASALQTSHSDGDEISSSPVASTDGGNSLSESRRRELADFLRTRREKLKPEQMGLVQSSRRRTPGLRREEVAELAGGDEGAIVVYVAGVRGRRGVAGPEDAGARCERAPVGQC